MTKCKKHPQYGGLRRPRSGCETCLAYFYARGEAAAQELAPKKKQPSERSVATKVRSAGTIKGQSLRIENDPLNGEFVLFIGNRCLYTATDRDSLDAFLSGFKEGARYVTLPEDIDG